ncbi:MAG: aldo/keto reductase [Clostridiales bacterium]|nr:aldo/keto reductase [Clostridiales bacterium]
MSLISEMPKKLGFGCMRLPVLDGKDDNIDEAAFCRMVDKFMERGFKYFDTAYPYHNEKSEEAVRRCVVERYPRESFYLADKMPVWLINSEADFAPIFERQLERTGAGYFDFYLLHALGKDRVESLNKNGGFEFLKKIKKDGKARHIGFSFHDSAEVLEDILKNHPEMDFVQLQLNYFDWDSDRVQSGACYAVAEKYGVPVIVMEPVKGGTLADMIGRPAEILKGLDASASYASFAIRFAASLPNVMVVLSGMSDEAQMADNISYMENFVPLSDNEKNAIHQVCEELEKMKTIECTRCRYCVAGCPKNIAIPDIFGVYNSSMQFGVNERTRRDYAHTTSEHGKASDCIRCGKCEAQCPQHLPIRDLLAEVAKTFE